MPQIPAIPAAKDNPSLPNFGDRLPDLTQALRHAGRDLHAAKPAQTYIPYFEDIYSVAHSLKGVTKILWCPKPVEDFILALNLELTKVLAGAWVCRHNKEAGRVFLRMADALDRDNPAEAADIGSLMGMISELVGFYAMDCDHEARLKGIPPHLFYVNEFVSKKAREIELLKLNHCVVEDQALLDEIPLWRTQLNDALLYPEFGRGVVVNFLPFLSPEGSRTLKLWAWVAAASHSRAGLKQRIKEIMPKVTLTKI